MSIHGSEFFWPDVESLIAFHLNGSAVGRKRTDFFLT